MRQTGQPTASAWRTSSYSGTQGNCVEAAWRKSSYSGTQGSCVEAAHLSTSVGVRDTKDRDGGTLSLPTAAWRSLGTSV